ncbi:MAG: hypothetical protein KGJ06_03980 [Pseudomonadota bacterium]|nr:hypothetical protein [Pseudomonadota bacterium]
MKISPSQQQSIIQILTRIYLDIREVEVQFGLLAGGEDLRPRIEYFHDAVRALSAEGEGMPPADDRLSIERLAYDLSCLRYIQAKPLAPFAPYGKAQPPGTDIVPVAQSLAVKHSARPDRAARERLSELYQRYAVLFAALLKPSADRDYQSRVDDLNNDVQDIDEVMHQLQGLAAGKGSVQEAAASVQQLEDGMRQSVLAFLQKQNFKRKDELKKMTQELKKRMAQKDKSIVALDAAQLGFGLAQLAIFEDSKDMLKKMAMEGMNLVGKFVQDAIAQTQRQMGR